MTQRAFQKGSVCPKLESGKIYLFGMRFCPFVTRVRLILSALNIEYETININLSNKPEWFLEKSAAGTVPVLENNGNVISESLAITEYLNDAHSKSVGSLYPIDQNERNNEEVLLEITGKLTVPIFKYIQGLLSVSEFWNSTEVLNKFEEELSNRGTNFFGGDKPMILDYVLWASTEVFLAFLTLKPELGSFPDSKYPKFAKWIGIIEKDPVVINTSRGKKLIASYLQSRIDGNVNYDIGL